VSTPPRSIVAACLIAVLPLAGGCRASRTLSQREIVVHFVLGTSLADRARVAEACARLPLASPEPLPASVDTPSAKLNEVRFRVDHASNTAIDRLVRCAQRFSAVRYVDMPPDQ
jgi:hypothetical protein